MESKIYETKYNKYQKIDLNLDDYLLVKEEFDSLLTNKAIEFNFLSMYSFSNKVQTTWYVKIGDYQVEKGVFLIGFSFKI